MPSEGAPNTKSRLKLKIEDIRKMDRKQMIMSIEDVLEELNVSKDLNELDRMRVDDIGNVFAALSIKLIREMEEKKDQEISE